MPDLNLIENLWAVVKEKMRNTKPNNEDDLKAAIKATCAVSQSDHRHAATHWCCDSCKRSVEYIEVNTVYRNFICAGNLLYVWSDATF